MRVMACIRCMPFRLAKNTDPSSCVELGSAGLEDLEDLAAGQGDAHGKEWRDMADAPWLAIWIRLQV